MDFRPVFYGIGIFLMILSLSLFIPLFIDFFAGNEGWKSFLIAIIITAFFGGLCIFSNSGHDMKFGVREAFLLTSGSWVVLCIFGAIPFWFGGLDVSITDAVFESVSGLTTTGATVFEGLDTLPHGILVWRAILQWLGGVGIIVMAFSVLPFLKVGGMQLFRTESSQKEKVMPRVAVLASSIGITYIVLTFACMIGYLISGLSLFEAFAHALTTISTGGFSTHDASIGFYDNMFTEMNAILFMIMGSLPFVFYLRMVQGNFKGLQNDTQIQWFFSILIGAILIMALYLMAENGVGVFQALRMAAFNICSIMTGTGYSTADFSLWGTFAVHMFFFVMVIGGCAGSTTCGIKIFRFQVLCTVAYTQIKKLLNPHGVFVMHYNHRPMPDDVPMSVMSFFFLYALCFSVLAVLLSMTGLDMLTSMSGAATSISNVGPGLGNEIGPGTTFYSLPDTAKWILCAGMILGRLELFTVLVLLAPHFWRR